MVLQSTPNSVLASSKDRTIYHGYIKSQNVVLATL